MLKIKDSLEEYKEIHFVTTELQFSPGQLLFSSSTDFMIYSMFQLLTKHLAGAVFTIYCREHLKKIQQKFLTQHSPSKRKKETGNNVTSSISNRNIFTFQVSVLSLPWTELT